MIEPNCDMPWEIYLDWLQDQGNEDLRLVDIPYFFVSGNSCYYPNNSNTGDGIEAARSVFTGFCSCRSGDSTLHGIENSDPHVNAGDCEQYGSSGDVAWCWQGDGIW